MLLLVNFCPAAYPSRAQTMASDYVSWVLGLQGWERTTDKEAYFAGWE